jgi:ubiquinone/menaquinone biosynthesis C-methylase UbiE
VPRVQLTGTRTTYNTVATSHAELVPTVDEDNPVDRAVLGAFADLVRAAGGGPVADIGCGTGRVTAFLDRADVDVSGIDLSPGMLAVARQNHPGLRFSEGSVFALDLPDGSQAGVVAWYSIIHMPPARLPAAFAKFHRVLAPGRTCS